MQKIWKPRTWFHCLWQKHFSDIKAIWKISDTRKKLYGENVGENVSFYNPCSISKSAKERRAGIVSLIIENPEITAGEIAIILEVSARTIERDLNWLKERAIIKRQGGAKNGIWIVEEWEIQSSYSGFECSKELNTVFNDYWLAVTNFLAFETVFWLMKLLEKKYY